MTNTDINKTEIIDCIGIDLGTTNTVVSYFDEAGSVTELKINNSSTIPSAIFFEDEGIFYFGTNALKCGRKNSQSMVKLFKRSIGDPKQKFSVVFNNAVQDEPINEGVFVIDTNCLVDDPELMFRAKKTETQYTAQRALENLDNAADRYACVITQEESDITLLPSDFFAPTSQNDENDDKVLSIAIRHRDEGVKLITSDNKLGRIKAAACQVESVKLKRFQAYERLNAGRGRDGLPPAF